MTMQVSGKVTCNGCMLEELAVGKVAAFINHHDIHFGEMTVRETLAFAGRCQGFGWGCCKEFVKGKMSRQATQTS